MKTKERIKNGRQHSCKWLTRYWKYKTWFTNKTGPTLYDNHISVTFNFKPTVESINKWDKHIVLQHCLACLKSSNAETDELSQNESLYTLKLFLFIIYWTFVILKKKKASNTLCISHGAVCCMLYVLYAVCTVPPLYKWATAEKS